MNRRTSVLIAALAMMLALAALWSFGRMARQRDAARAAESDLDECASMVRRIGQLSSRPALAAEREKLSSEITGLIERNARSAGIPPQALNRINPGAPRPIPGTAYKEKPTQVLLRDVTLRQLVTLMVNLTSAEPGLRVSSIRLTNPKPEETAGKWTAELALTYLIYEPPRAGKLEVTAP